MLDVGADLSVGGSLGQGEVEATALALLALHPNFAFVRVDDVLGDGQAQPGAAAGPPRRERPGLPHHAR